jgi:hypothetical protein
VTHGFSEELPIGRVRDGDRMDLAADADERAAIADRLGLVRLDRLEAHVELIRESDAVRARGRVKASLEQSCVVTGEPIAASADEAFDLRFLPQPDAFRPDEEVELAESDCDTLYHDGRTLRLGEAIADTLALCLDPYPRSAAAEATLKEAGVLSEEEAGPFAALARLRQPGPSET